jgi:hypothetical protein
MLMPPEEFDEVTHLGKPEKDTVLMSLGQRTSTPWKC